jgi:hypothetical protein
VIGVGLITATSALVVGGCLDRPLCADCKPVTTNIFVETVQQRAVNKIDLLFVIDNSSSMGDKQVVLSQAVPDLVKRLVNPRCVDAAGKSPAAPVSAKDVCPDGFTREFTALSDIHVGVITSSLGGHGGVSCTGKSPKVNVEQANDGGYLLGTRDRFKAAVAAQQGLEPVTNAGFLDWNPGQHQGETDGPFNATFTLMTQAAGEEGCGYEAQLESLYRFLVDPAPYLSIETAPCAAGSNALCAIKRGVDKEVLRQRAAFLRPDSLVAIALLTDENDCSLRDTQQGFYAADNQFLQSGSAACATNPNDPCCYPCGSPAPGCAPDANCKAQVDSDFDQPNLRCFEQKKRFGFDFLYPTTRYVNALSQKSLCTSVDDLDATDPTHCPDLDGDKKPDLFPNPLFQGTTNALPRQPSLVFLAGIVGVPWQDIRAAKDANGTDYDPNDANELHYKSAATMEKDGTWDVILGDAQPQTGGPPILPKDGLMIESMGGRNQTDGQGHALALPDSGLFANPINGHEFNDVQHDDLQYACIFPLPRDPATGDTKRSCAGNVNSCDCQNDVATKKSPLCQNPQTGGYQGTDQYFAKAYPGLRELEVLKKFGKNSIVASICAKNLENDTAQSYGYRPAIDAIVDRLKEELSDRCLPRVLKRDVTGQIPCSVVEVRPRAEAPTCDPARGREEPDESVVGPVYDRLRAAKQCDAPGLPACTEFHLCKLKEAKDECHQNQDSQPNPGWCYVDPANNPADDASLVKTCPPNERRIIRFVDDQHATPAIGAQVLIACFGADLDTLSGGG